MKELKKLLLKSYDEDISSEEKNQLDKGLQESEELRKAKSQLDTMRGELSRIPATFSPDFSDNLMKKVDELDLQTTLPIYSLFKGVAISGAAAIIALLISIYYTDGSLSLDAIFGLYNYVPDDAAIAFFNQ